MLLADPRIDVNKQTDDGSSPFLFACQSGHKEVVSLLLADPRIEPNHQSVSDGATPFSKSCQYGRPEVVSLLLADPRIDPSKPLDDGATPFFVACQEGHGQVVGMLLLDARVDPNSLAEESTSPLWMLSQGCFLEGARILLASERQIDTTTICTATGNTAAQQGRAMSAEEQEPEESLEDHNRRITNGSLVADLIDEYERDSMSVRHRLRRTPGIRNFYIVHTFAVVVFFCDGFLRINGATTPSSGVERFFKICSRLPLELQMIICNRMFGSPNDLVKSKDSEPGFKWLARSTTWAHSS